MTDQELHPLVDSVVPAHKCKSEQAKSIGVLTRDSSNHAPCLTRQSFGRRAG